MVPEMNNFCGLGAVNNSKQGTGGWFSPPQEGVRAQMQHLKGYASTEPVQEPIVDPRYAILKQYGLLGKATKWVDLAGRWAYPGFDKNKYPSLEAAMKVRATYGQRILDLHSKMLAIEVPEPETGVDLSNIPEWAQESWIWAYENGLNDGVVQNEFELQMVKMLHAYHLKFVKEGK